jgi:hypothetical protein
MNSKEAYNDRINRITKLAAEQKENQKSHGDYLQKAVRSAVGNALRSIPEDYRDTEASVKNILSLRKEYKEKLEKVPRTPVDGTFQADQQYGTCICFRTDWEDKAWSEVEFYSSHFNVYIQDMNSYHIQTDISYDRWEVSSAFTEGKAETPDKNDADLLAKAAADGLKRLAVFEQLFNIGIDMDLGRYTEEFYPYKCTAFLFPSKLRNGYIPEPEAVPFFLDTAEALSKEHVADILSMTMEKAVDPCEISRIDTPERMSMTSRAFGEELVVPAIHAWLEDAGLERSLDYNIEYNIRNNRPCIIVTNYAEDRDGFYPHTEYIHEAFQNYQLGKTSLTDTVTDSVLQVIDNFTGIKHGYGDAKKYVDAVLQAYEKEPQKDPGSFKDTSPDIDAETFGVLTLRTIRAYMDQSCRSSGADYIVDSHVKDGQPYIILENMAGRQEKRVQGLLDDYLSGEKDLCQSVSDAALFALFDFYGEEFSSEVISMCADSVVDAWENHGENTPEPEQEEDEWIDR